jgi:hypothetical protein
MVNRLKDENKRINDVLINTKSAIINQQQGLGNYKISFTWGRLS